MVGIWALTLLLMGLLTIQYLKLLWKYRQYPPGPFPLPLMGSIWKIGFGPSPDSFLKFSKQYGSIYTLWIAHRPLVVLSGFQAVRDALINHSEKLQDRPLTPFMREAFNRKGIAFANGLTWKQHRRFVIATMRNLGMGKKSTEHRIQEEALHLVEFFSQTKGQPFEPCYIISNIIASVISVALFGTRFSPEDEKFHELLAANDYFEMFLLSGFHTLYNLFPWLMEHLPGPHKKAFSCAKKGISFITEEIQKHRKNQNLHEPQDLIDFYLIQLEKSKSDLTSTFDDENLAQCVLDLLVAGTETTSTTLQWAVLLMVAYPDIQDKVYKEIEDVLGSSHSICYKDRKKLPFTNAVIHEVQRAKYILPISVPRFCMEEMNMCGMHIPKKTFIVTDLKSVLTDPKRWEAPGEFNPNHFLDKDGNFVDRKEFLPFGAGARVCLGEQLARMELFLFLAHIVRAFKLQLPEGIKELTQEPMMGASLHPSPYKLCAIPRSHLL